MPKKHFSLYLMPCQSHIPCYYWDEKMGGLSSVQDFNDGQDAKSQLEQQWYKMHDS